MWFYNPCELRLFKNVLKNVNIIFRGKSYTKKKKNKKETKK